ncbi:MAG TPA: right-handed parallel beta-helix repeat-containing protein [Abditibacteriaceae bacterium]
MQAQKRVAVELYVAGNGNDRWSGKLPAPNKNKTDGPLASLQGARDEIRRRKTKGALFGGARVLVRGGFYGLKETLQFEPQDSGTANAPIIYQSYRNEKPVLSGGTRITGWKVVNDKTIGRRWIANLPDVKNGSWNFTQLFVNGERRYRPRLPQNGYYHIAAAVGPSPKTGGKGHDRFAFRRGDVNPDWYNIQDVEFLMMQVWTMARMRAANIDTQSNIVTFNGQTRTEQWYGAFPKGHRYIVENVREALDEPGEWYLNRKNGTLEYIPRAGETPQNTVVIAPRLEKLVELRGDVAKRQWVQHITLRGLTFAHGNWALSREDNSFYQAEAHLSGAISGIGARDISLQNCTIKQVGIYAVEWGAGCKRNVLQDCDLLDLGAGGVKIGEMQNVDDEENVASHNIVRNCTLAHGGRIHPAAVGVWIGHSPYNIIEHNDIYDFYYTGVSPGWSWGYGKSGAHHNTIAHNHIWQMGQGVLSDMGGIYTLGLSPGTVLHHNLIHDVQSFDYGGWGIYFDEGTTDAIAENNVVYRTKSAGFHQHYGKNNVVRNNIFALGGEAQLMRTRPEEHLSFTLERNIIAANDAPILGSNWTDENFKLDHNLYWNFGTEPMSFSGATWQQWQARGHDANSLIADPLFVDWKKGDLRLEPDSPALKLGFVPIDLRRVGRQSTHRVLTTMPRAFPPPPPPQPVTDDYEMTPVAQKPDANVSEENQMATVRVTEETAASGKRSLKFTDAAGQQHAFNPHVWYSPGFKSGRVAASFDLRLEPGAVMYHEWRDNASPYHAGPSLRVLGDGSLLAAGRTLTKLPHGQWVHFEIDYELGGSTTYNLRIRVPGQQEQSFNNLIAASSLKSLHWFGFVADANEAAVFYLDNVQISPPDSGMAG